MAEETQASPQEAPPAPEATPEASAAAAPVSAESGKADRPVENWVGEFSRKLTKQQQQMDQMLAVLAAQQQARQAPQQAPKELSNDDLWSMAQQGDRTAFEEYQRRQAREELRRELTIRDQVQTTQAQVQALMQKYPMFQDGAHALTQTALQARQLLIRAGQPDTQDTLLRAMLTAVAERPDLVSEHYGQATRAAEQQRRSATQISAAGQTGASHRRQAPAASTKPSEAQIAQAKRMGNKDPEGVMKRFYERQAEGKSSVSPMLKAVLESEEGA